MKILQEELECDLFRPSGRGLALTDRGMVLSLIGMGFAAAGYTPYRWRNMTRNDRCYRDLKFAQANLEPQN